MRHDMTDWVMHFVHARNPELNPREFYSEDGEPVPFPYVTDGEKNSRFSEYYDSDDAYPIEPDAYASQVLIKILDDGYIQSSWAFRKRKNAQPRATIYGPRSAVCFTEMPLSSLLDYAKARNNNNAVQTMGIALKKTELFAAGGRPVIYGLSVPHEEITNEDWPRFLKPECGLSELEQYRYVATNLENTRMIDWTHEREWRWADLQDQCGCPGLPIWLAQEPSWFSEALIIVPDDELAERVLNKIKELNDSGYNNYDVEYRRSLLEKTRVISLETVDKRQGSLNGPLRIEDLPNREFLPVKRPKPSAEMLERVKIALRDAQDAGTRAALEWEKNAERNEKGEIRFGGFGFSWIEVGDPQSEFMQALIELDEVEVIGGIGYRLHQMTKGANTGLLDQQEVATRAAVLVLEERFPEISFWTNWRWD